MTLEDRLNELETAIQALRRDMHKERKFKVGDAVLIPGVIDEVDPKDGTLPYRVKFGEGSDFDAQWFSESYLQPKAP